MKFPVFVVLAVLASGVLADESGAKVAAFRAGRVLRVEGEDLEGSHPATEFVAWYNGHPDFADLQFDLSQEREERVRGAVRGGRQAALAPLRVAV